MYCAGSVSVQVTGGFGPCGFDLMDISCFVYG